MNKLATILSLFVLAIVSPPVHAMQDQTYGLGGTTTGRVGGVTAEPDNAFASLLNPALMPIGPKQFSFSMSYVDSDIRNPTNVVVDNRAYRTRDGQKRVGEASMPQAKTALWALGYNYPFSLSFWPNHRAGFGLALSGPFDQFRHWLALSPYDFTPLRYGAADTQFKGTLSGALELIPQHLFIGGGLSLFLTSAGITEASLNAANPTGRMVMDVGFNTAGLVGLYSSFDSWGMAVVYRQVVNPVFHQTFIGELEVAGTPVANQPAAVQTSLYFEPAVLEFDAQKELGSLVASAGVSFQQWSQYSPRYMNLSTRDASGGSRSTTPALVPTKDIWSPRASLEWRGFTNWKLSAGYQFRPSPVVDLSQAGNLVDTDIHVMGMSIQRNFGNLLFFDQLSLSVFGQAHVLSTRNVVKTDPEFVGSPGYPISGRVFLVGLSLSSKL
jgi:long-subunit fatty acid transport protein